MEKEPSLIWTSLAKSSANMTRHSVFILTRGPVRFVPSAGWRLGLRAYVAFRGRRRWRPAAVPRPLSRAEAMSEETANVSVEMLIWWQRLVEGFENRNFTN